MVQHILHLVVFFAFGAIFMAFHKPTLIVKGQPVQKYNCSECNSILSIDYYYNYFKNLLVYRVD